jgi:hypothetical protein
MHTLPTRIPQSPFVALFSPNKNIFACIELLSASSGLMLRPTSGQPLSQADQSTPLPLFEKVSMIRPMLPVVGALLLCAQSFCVFAADSTSASTASTSAATLREQVETQRDQLSGVAQISQTTQKSSSTLLDAPVATDDAPTQVQQP